MSPLTLTREVSKRLRTNIPGVRVTTKRLSADERRKQILRSAISVFAQATYHGATTKRISEEAGITEALIYRYFGSKRKLFTEAILLTSKRLVSGLEETLDTHRDQPFLALTECFKFYAHYLEKHQDLAKMIFLVISELDQEDVREAYLPEQERALKCIAETLTYWNEQGYTKENLDIQTGSWLYYGTYLILALVKQSHGGLQIDPNFAVEMARPYFKDEVWQEYSAAAG